ncbi:MAG: glycosyltransferase family 4 protein [Chloroflexi bacterium OHK40]
MTLLRIAHVSPTLVPAGAGAACLHYARELARRGHKPAILTAAVPGAPAFEETDGYTVRRLRTLPRVGSAPLLPGLVAALRGYDLVHLHYPAIASAELLRIVTALRDTPIVVSLHSDLPGGGGVPATLTLLRRLATALQDREAPLVCAIAPEHGVASRLRCEPGRVPLLMAELPNGVDCRAFAPGPPDPALRSRFGIPATAPLTLGVVGPEHVRDPQGFEVLLAAFSRLPREHRLLVIGVGAQPGAGAAAVARIDLGDRIVCAGEVDQHALPAYYRTAQLSAFPARLQGPLASALVESLACATPVVASGIPGVRALVEQTRGGLIVQPDNAMALAEAIGWLSADEALRRAMGRVGRRRVLARYAWEAVGARLEELYLDALNPQLAGGGSNPPQTARHWRERR